MNAVLYLRKSRKDLHNPDTLSKHREVLTDLAASSDCKIVEVYEEIVSGENLFTRPQMLRLLQDMEKQKFEAVLCMDIDRLGRGSLTNQGIILEAFQSCGCKIITPRHTYDLQNDFDAQYSEFEAFLARQEYRLITRRMRAGLIKSVENGGHVGEVPFGYQRAYQNNLPTLVPKEPQASFVRLAFHLYSEKQASCQEIADIFTNAGIPPKKTAAGWNRTTILRMLKNEVYIGNLYWNRKHKVKRKTSSDLNRYIPNPPEQWIFLAQHHPPLISYPLFSQVQSRFPQKIPAPRKAQNPFAGLLFCGYCRSGLQRQKGKNPSTDRLFCPHCHENKSISMIQIENALLSFLSDQLKGYRFSPTSPDLEQTAAYQKQLFKIEKQIKKVTVAYENNLYPDDFFKERITELNHEKNYLKNLLKTEKIQSPVLQTFDEYYHTLPDAASKNALFKCIFKRIVYERSSNDKNFLLKLYF